MSGMLSPVGQPVARAADALLHNRDRRRRIRQFQRVERVTLVAESAAAGSHPSPVGTTSV